MPAPEIEAEAAEWLIRLEEDGSAARRAQFDSWLAADVRNQAAFLRLQKSWVRANFLKKLQPLDGGVDQNVLDKFGQPVPIREESAEEPGRRERWLALAASLLLVAAGGTAWFGVVRSQWQVYTTDVGGFQRVALQDGSTVLLNTDSEIRVRLEPERRQVVLSRGEALFKVVHDSHRSFAVSAADTIVRAVGTEFSVRLRDQKQLDVIVAEGRVAIGPPDGPLDNKLPQPDALPAISALVAGETVSITARRPHVEKISADEMKHKLAWTQGRLWFERVRLAQAISEFNRYNRRQLRSDDPAIADLRIGGTFDATDLDSFVAALKSFGIRAFPERTRTDDPEPEIIRLVGTEAGR